MNPTLSLSLSYYPLITEQVTPFCSPSPSATSYSFPQITATSASPPTSLPNPFVSLGPRLWVLTVMYCNRISCVFLLYLCCLGGLSQSRTLSHPQQSYVWTERYIYIICKRLDSSTLYRYVMCIYGYIYWFQFQMFILQYFLSWLLVPYFYYSATLVSECNIVLLYNIGLQLLIMILVT